MCRHSLPPGSKLDSSPPWPAAYPLVTPIFQYLLKPPHGPPSHHDHNLRVCILRQPPRLQPARQRRGSINDVHHLKGQAKVDSVGAGGVAALQAWGQGQRLIGARANADADACKMGVQYLCSNQLALLLCCVAPHQGDADSTTRSRPAHVQLAQLKGRVVRVLAAPLGGTPAVQIDAGSDLQTRRMATRVASVRRVVGGKVGKALGGSAVVKAGRDGLGASASHRKPGRAPRRQCRRRTSSICEG